jgi:hypothetical protein
MGRRFDDHDVVADHKEIIAAVLRHNFDWAFWADDAELGEEAEVELGEAEVDEVPDGADELV